MSIFLPYCVISLVKPILTMHCDLLGTTHSYNTLCLDRTDKLRLWILLTSQNIPYFTPIYMCVHIPLIVMQCKQVSV